jgi:hypothetical protein
MKTRTQPLKGTPESRRGDNRDSGAPDDGRAAVETAREGRSRKAADNASDRTPIAKRRRPLPG